MPITFKIYILTILINLTACSYNNNIHLTEEENSILKNEACTGAPLIFLNTAVNRDIVKRWSKLCPNRKITFSDKAPLRGIVITAAASFDKKAQLINDVPARGKGPLCTWEPYLQTVTLYIIPVICSYTDNFGPCIRIGPKEWCLKPPTIGESVEFTGWIPIFTHGIPHYLGSLWSDRLEDRLIAIIQKELKRSR